MEYKGIEYSVVQTANPSGWKWTVVLGEKKTRTGDSWSRAAAILDAEDTINKAIKIKPRKYGRLNWPSISHQSQTTTESNVGAGP
jgi:hypothetical protein